MPREAANTATAVPRAARIVAVVLLGVCLGGRAIAAGGEDRSPEQYAVHGQLTYVEQEADSFAAPYRGANSLTPDRGRETVDATLYIGKQLWSGAEGWMDAELDQGFGLDNTLGLAGFPSGEAYKVGRSEPYFRLTRAFIRQTWDLGGNGEEVEGAQNQLAGSRRSDRLVLTLGKFSVTDVFDTNRYAHDPRGDFLNWAVLDAGSFDYAADAWGYTVGAALEWWGGAWTFRAGAFDLSDVPNSPHLDPGGHEFQAVIELERRLEFLGRPTRVLVTAYQSRGRMALLDQAVAEGLASGTPVDGSSVRSFRSRAGIHVSLEQRVSESVGLFARIGGASGNVEVYEFTDVDRSIAAGVTVNGAGWRRPRDTFALAAVENQISAARKRYFDAGGLGLLIGDGRLPHAGAERVLEAYYDVGAPARCHVTLDYQRIVNPAYNRDRGPVGVAAVRLHVDF